MPTFKISGGAYQNVDEFALTDQSSQLMDAFVDELQNTVKRPGLLQWANVASNHPITGINYDYNGNAFLACCNGVVYKINIDGTVSTVSGATVGTLPAIFASDGTTTWIATGATHMAKYASGTLTYDNYSASAGPPAVSASPQNSTHVAFLDGYIICNKINDNKFYFTDPTTRTSWPLYNYSQLASSPDPIIALFNFFDNLYLFSPRRLEIWRNDGNAPFSITAGGFIKCGLSAPYSVIHVGIENKLYWLDDRRRFVVMQGYIPKPVSTPFQKLLQNMPRVDDCIASEVSVYGQSFIILAFPTANITLVYNYTLDEWQEWGTWIDTLQIYNRFPCDISTMANVSVSGAFIPISQYASAICGGQNGVLYKLSEQAGTDNGGPIRFLRRTGHVTHGTLKRKRCKFVVVRAKAASGVQSQFSTLSWMTATGTWAAQSGSWLAETGPALTSTFGQNAFWLRYNDDNNGWNDWIEIPLDGSEEGNLITYTLQQLGIYITRQYEIMNNDTTSGVIFVEAEEEAEVLSR